MCSTELGQSFLSAPRKSAATAALPRVITALELLQEDSDPESVFCFPGPDGSELTTQVWSFLLDTLPKRRRSKTHADEDEDSCLVQPSGLLDSEVGTYLCSFPVCLEDFPGYGLVERITGSNRQNLNRIARDCNATLHLRGRGSGFAEGAHPREASTPMHLLLRCTDYANYMLAVSQVAKLLRQVFAHYRRHMRSRRLQPPELKVSVDELVRSDLDINLLSTIDESDLSDEPQPQQQRRSRRRRVRKKDRLPSTGS
ncbi:unnamed protein product [Polarella glacialis]|uniref:KHDC4/BBP-like KH-domain type I domain-containing protein n=1 Tax=Polarella glacialis TaxID=89957 RepID=A0A813HX59_POLGL|nr:unnamed protein product [Polarella glacialis]